MSRRGSGWTALPFALVLAAAPGRAADDGAGPSARAALVFGVPQMLGVSVEGPLSSPLRFEGSFGVGPAFALTARGVAVHPVGAVTPYVYAGGGVLAIAWEAGDLAGNAVVPFLWAGGGLRAPFGTAELFGELGVLGDVGLSGDLGAAAVGLRFPVTERGK